MSISFTKQIIPKTKKVYNNVVTKAVNNSSNSGEGTVSSTANNSGKTIPAPSGKVSTNTSYNGSYLDVDLGTDYQAKINQATANGDYNAAAQYEAQRNAKINYLNSINQNTGKYQTTTNYLTDYSNKTNSTNNKDGISYTSSYNDFSNLPSNWKTANVNGNIYKNDDGIIYQQTGYLNGTPNYRIQGNRINPETGEWMFDNYDDAKRAAYEGYLSSIGGGNFANQEEAFKYLDSNNVLSDDYIKRVMNGTQGQYSQKLADEMYNKEQKALIDAKKQQALEAYYDDDEYNNLSDANKQVLNNNSFETDMVTDYRYQNDYYDYMSNQELKRRTGVL